VAIVGHAYVEIRALSERFNKDIQKGLQSSLGDTGEKLGKQLANDFSRAYKETVEDKLKGKIRIGAPDISEAKDALEELGDEVDRVGKRTKRTNRSFSDFGRTIKKLDNHLLEAFGSMLKFGGGFTGLLMTLDAAGAAIGLLLGPLSAFASGLVALSGAIAPAAKSIGILPGLLSAVITPAIAASLALSGLGKAYEAGAAAAAGGGKELKKYKEALEKLNPKQAEFVKHLVRHKDAIDKVKNSASEKIFDGLSKGLDRVVKNGFLDRLADGLADAGGAVGYLADKTAELTGKPFFKKAFSNTMEANVTIIRRLGRAFLNLVGYFTLVAQAARPFTIEFAAWIETITSNWLTKARGDFEGLRKSIGDGVGVAKQLGDVFGNIFSALGNIGRAARPAGQILLDAFEGATEKFDEWTNSTEGQERMEEFFLNITDTTRAFGDLLVSVTREFGKLGENQSFSNLLRTLADDTIPKIAASIDSLVSVAGDDLIGIFDTLADIGAVMADSGGLEAYLEVMRGFLKVLEGIVSIPGFSKIAGHLLAITGAVKGLSLIAKFTGVEWLITTGIPQLGQKSKEAMRTLGPLALAIYGLYELAELSNQMSGKEDQSPWLTILQSPIDGLTAGWESTKGLFSTIKQGFTDFSKWVIPEGSGFKNWLDDILPTDEEVSSAVTGFFDKLWFDLTHPDWGGVGDWFKEVLSPPDMSAWEDLGKDVVKGLAKGIKDEAKETWDQIKEFGNGIVIIFKETLGIHSPSTVFAELGRNIVQGLINGIMSMPSRVGTTFQNVVSIARTKFEELKTSAKGQWSSLSESIVGAADRARRGAASAFSGAQRRVSELSTGAKLAATANWRGLSSAVSSAAASARDGAARAMSNLGTRVASSLGQLRTNASGIWSGIRTSVVSISSGIVSSVAGSFRRLRTSVVESFESAKRGIGRAWGQIRGLTKAPVSFVVNTVFNRGLRKAFNTVASILPGVPSIPEIKGFATGGWTGPGSKYTPAGVVHADEFVIKKESRKRLEQQAPGLLDYLNQKGKLPGYASGGLVAAARWWQKLGARASEHPLFGGVRPGHMKNSLHYRGQAVDLNYGPGGENAIEKAFFDRHLAAFKAKFPGLGVLWRVPNHFNHMHIDTSGAGRNSGGGGGGFPSLSSLLNPFKKLTTQLSEGVGGGKFGDLLKGAGKRVISGSIDLVKSKFSSLAESAGDVVGNIVGGVKKAGARATVQGLAALRGWGSGKQWAALDWIVNKESSWNPNAANPRSSARGLFQKMTSIHGPLESSVLGQAKWGLNYIAKRYGNPVKAMQFHKSHGYYANGGRVEPVKYAGVFDSGGFLSPGLNLVNNKTGGFEELRRPDQMGGKELAAAYRSLADAIRSTFGSTGGMSGAGTQIVAGLAAGMRAGVDAIRGTASDLASSVVSTAQDVLEIHSPSRVFERFGLNIDQGLVKGLLKGRNELNKVTESILKKLTGFAEDRVDSMADAILESYRRANQAIKAENKKIAAYNRTHKKDKARKDLLQMPTRKQAEEEAKRRLGFSQGAIDSAKSLVSKFNKVTESIWKDGADAGTDRLVKISKGFKTSADIWKRISLADLASGAENLSERIKQARENLADFRNKHAEMVESVASGVRGGLDLTSTSTPTDATKSSITFKTIAANTKALATKARTLADLLKRLTKSGMPAAFVQQVAALGLDDAIAVSRAVLSGSLSERAALTKDFNAIDVGGKAAGVAVANQMYGVGVNAAKGLVKGLEANKKELTRAAKSLANRLEREVKKELGIRSPSRVFAELGKFLPLGLVVGIRNSTSAAVRAVSTLSEEMTRAFDPNLAADPSVTPNSTSAIAALRSNVGRSGESVDGTGLTARDRAMIEALREAGLGVNITINPPPETDIYTLARQISRELEFRGN
jgi:hypothetical protein